MSEHKDEQNQEDLGFLDGMVQAVRADAPEEAQWQAARRNLMGRLEAPQKENVMTRVFGRSRSRKIGWAAAAGIAAIAVALLVGLNPWGRGGPGQAFAAVVEQFRNARTVSYIMTSKMEGKPALRMEVAFKEPGYMRITTSFPDLDIDPAHPKGSANSVFVVDLTRGKFIELLLEKKQFREWLALEDNVAGPPGLNMIERLRALPGRADDLLEEREMDGQLVQGFRVNAVKGGTVIVWLNADTWDLVRVEEEMRPPLGVVRVVMSDFQFDVELDDSLFSLSPPEGYTRLPTRIVDTSGINEQDLIGLLRSWATRAKDNLFPPTLDPVGFLDVVTEMEKAGNFREGTEEEGWQWGTQIGRGILFLMQMKPENDWHYAGEGVQLGDAVTPICWWKPDGSETYRVIYGDLSIKDIAPEDIPSEKQIQDTE